MIGQTRFIGNGRQFCLGQPQGIARTKWGECILLEKGECDSPLQMGHTRFSIPLGRGKYVGAYGIRPDDQTWGDGMGRMHFGGKWANVAYTNDWANALLGNGRQFCLGQPQGIAPTKWGECDFPYHWGVGDFGGIGRPQGSPLRLP